MTDNVQYGKPRPLLTGDSAAQGRIGSSVRMVDIPVGQGSHAVPWRYHGAKAETKALMPFQRLSHCVAPEAVSLRTVECFRVSQNVGQSMVTAFLLTAEVFAGISPPRSRKPAARYRITGFMLSQRKYPQASMWCS